MSCNASARYGQRMPEMPFEFRALLNQIFSSQTFGVIVAIGIVWMIIAFLLATYADGALMGMVNTIGGGQKVGVGLASAPGRGASCRCWACASRWRCPR